MKREIIAVTGGIGCGKTTAINVIKELGYKVFSCDEYTDSAYQNPKIQKKLIKAFNTCEKSEIKKLASDKRVLTKLTQILSPAVFKITLKNAKKEKEKTFVEVPLLFECGYQKYFSKIIVIKRPLSDRIESVKKRSNLSEEEILSRISAQVNYENISLKNCIVILNDGDVLSLKEKLISAIE